MAFASGKLEPAELLSKAYSIISLSTNVAFLATFSRYCLLEYK